MKLIQSIQLQNLLSFGSEAERIELGDLNILIGANGSGKSNLIDAIDLLRCAPRNIRKPISEGGGIVEWLWKGTDNPSASLDAVIQNKPTSEGHTMDPLRYTLCFTETNQQTFLASEKIANAEPYQGKTEAYIYYTYDGAHGEKAMLNIRDTENNNSPRQRHLTAEEINTGQSILSQRNDPDLYPELAYLSGQFKDIAIYREWSFGRKSLLRNSQPVDMPNDILMPDGSNLALLLNRMRKEPAIKKQSEKAHF